MNIWIPKPIIELTPPGPGFTLRGRTKPRVQRARSGCEGLINRTLAAGGQVLPEWFVTVREGAWSRNLVTSVGRDAMAVFTMSQWWQYYHVGTSTATPSVADTGLAAWHRSANTLTALPFGYDTRPMVHDYLNGRITHRRCFVFPQQTEAKTYTEGGVSAYSANTNINTRFLFGTPVNVGAGEYFSPIYELEVTVSPSTADQAINPVLDGWWTSAQARIETLAHCFEWLNGNGNYYNNTPSLSSPLFDLEAIDLPLVGYPNDNNFPAGTVPANSSYDQLYVGYDYGQNQLNGLMWPNWNAGGGVMHSARSALLFYIGGYSEMVGCASTPTVMTTATGDAGSFTFGALNDAAWYDTRLDAVASIQAYVAGSFTRSLQIVLNQGALTMSGIRSFGFGYGWSPYGQDYWSRASLYRVLLSNPMVKDGSHILTINFTLNWS